jgi:hypothetical protein
MKVWCICDLICYGGISCLLFLMKHFVYDSPEDYNILNFLQIRKPGFDSRHFQKKKVVGLERGTLSLVSTTKELLDRKVAAPV